MAEDETQPGDEQCLVDFRTRGWEGAEEDSPEACLKYGGGISGGAIRGNERETAADL